MNQSKLEVNSLSWVEGRKNVGEQSTIGFILQSGQSCNTVTQRKLLLLRAKKNIAVTGVFGKVPLFNRRTYE